VQHIAKFLVPLVLVLQQLHGLQIIKLRLHVQLASLLLPAISRLELVLGAIELTAAGVFRALNCS
jgi:hypothetical protein